MASDLISRSALVEAMEKKYDVAEKTGLNAVGLDCGFIITEKIIREQPTVDAVEVVRCKDCINGARLDELITYPKNQKSGFVYCKLHRAVLLVESYCSFGAKLDGGKDEDSNM